MGERIVAAVPSGDVALFIATPGSANLQPRIEGAEKAIKASGKPITMHTVATGAAVPGELSTIEAYWIGHQSTKGMYAVDGGSTESLAKVMQKFGLPAKGIKAGGFDLTEQTQKLLQEGNIEFTIDQQPYLQGFLPILQLFLWQVSGSLTGPAETDTGLKFLNKETVAPYVESKTRYEGTSSAVTVVPIKAGHARLADGERGRGSRPAPESPTPPRAGPAPKRAGPRRRDADRAWRERVLVAARGQHHRRHDRRRDLLLGRTRAASSRRPTSRRCCRTSPRSRSSARARCS